MVQIVISDEHIKFHNKIKIKYFDEIITTKITKLTLCKIKPKNLSYSLHLINWKTKGVFT